MQRRELIAMLAATAAAPCAAHGQSQPLPVVGVLVDGFLTMPDFSRGLAQTGYEDGRTVTLDYRYSDNARFPAEVADLVRREVAVIVAFGPAAALAAKRATSTIPIVFLSGDPVVEGLVSNLARPGGNLTGISKVNAELMPKRLQLLSELVPKARTFVLLVNPKGKAAAAVIRRTQEAARARKVTLLVVEASSTFRAIDNAFAALRRRHVDALIVDPDSYLGPMFDYPVRSASRDAIPAIYGMSLAAWSGGLISYGPSIEDSRRQVGVYVGKILHGARPADLPVAQPDKLELAINMKTAKALGITVPPLLLMQATTVIE